MALKIWIVFDLTLYLIPQILEVMNNPHEGQESASLTNSAAGQQEEEQRHRRLMAENEDLKKQIAEVSSAYFQ